MVGIGASGRQSALARCGVVDFDGNVLYDEFVRPPGFVTDFRTKYSGIRKKDLRAGVAVTLQEVSGLSIVHLYHFEYALQSFLILCAVSK